MVVSLVYGKSLLTVLKIQYILVQNRQGKTRLSKWFDVNGWNTCLESLGMFLTMTTKNESFSTRSIAWWTRVKLDLLLVLLDMQTLLKLDFCTKLCLTWSQFRTYKIVYRRYAGLFFCMCVELDDNELATLEVISKRAYHYLTELHHLF